MAKAIDISLLGDKRLQRKLHALIPKVQKKIVRAAARKAARPVLAQAKANVPVDTGALRDNLKVRSITRSRQWIGVRVVTPTREALGIEPDDPGYYPAHVEYGTEHVAARPYLRDAMDSTREKAKSIMAKEIAQRIVKEAKKG